MGIEGSIAEVFKVVDQYWYLFAGAVVLAIIIGKTMGKKYPLDLNQFVKSFEKHEKKSEKINKIDIPKSLFHGNHFLGVVLTYTESEVIESDIKKAFKNIKDMDNLPEFEKAKILQDFKSFVEVKMIISQRNIFKKIPFPIFSDNIILRLNKKDISFYKKKIVIPSKLRISYTIGNQYIVMSDNSSEQVSRVHDDMMTLLTNYAFTVQTKNMEKLAGNEPIFAQARELIDREIRKETEKKRLKREKY